MKVNYQENLGEENKERERLYKFYNGLKATQAKCQWGSKDCEGCEDKECKMRPYLLKSPYWWNGTFSGNGFQRMSFSFIEYL